MGSGPDGTTPLALAARVGEAFTKVRSVPSRPLAACRSLRPADTASPFVTSASTVRAPRAGRSFNCAPGRSSRNGSLSSVYGRSGFAAGTAVVASLAGFVGVFFVLSVVVVFLPPGVPLPFPFPSPCVLVHASLCSLYLSSARASFVFRVSRASCSRRSHIFANSAFVAAPWSKPRARSRYSSKRNRHPHVKSCSVSIRCAKSKCFSSMAHRELKNTARMVGSFDMRETNKRSIHDVGVAPAKTAESSSSPPIVACAAGSVVSRVLTGRINEVCAVIFFGVLTVAPCGGLVAGFCVSGRDGFVGAACTSVSSSASSDSDPSFTKFAR
mmetsp:Transcript_6171/g.20676  ORF Transcript_6171/g.20676 Transcript_6171/m.20676 type:complete len:327 (-) Transcript_6171:1422-2402(-)